MAENTSVQTDSDDLPDLHKKSFLGHLEDLRSTILWSLLFLLVGIVIAIPLAPFLVEILSYPIETADLHEKISLKVIHVGGPVLIAMKLILWTGILLSIPFIVLTVARFVFPGLTKKEKTVAIRGATLAVLLFISGVIMGYVWTLPVALKVTISIGEWLKSPAEFWETSNYVSFVLRLLIAFGLAFQLPVVVLALGKLGIIDSSQLRSKRRHVIVGLMIMAMFLTPSDPFTMVLMATPLIALYEGCIWIIWAGERGEKS
ncbi:twin-arginine translocase subunit TatC [PVC group bacterium]|nr:twin-arginine translocase subunit TatC [PVC group bacterium]